MKNLETFFELSNYNSKNITNKGSATISQDTLNEIESKGVTLEFMNALNVPIFKYKTQLTIHGLFPELKNNYLGGYKNLFQNKNLSIGVKWQAVDYAKKQTIYSILQKFSGWSKQHNSSEYFVYKTSKYFQTKEEYKTMLEATKTDISQIDKNLFFGNSGVYLSQTLYGAYYLVTYINIGAILESNVTACIENITKASMNEIETKFAEMKAQSDKETSVRKAQYEIDLQERKAKQLPLLETARKILIESGYTSFEKMPIQDATICIKIETNVDTQRFSFVAYKYSKNARQKKFRYVKANSNDLNFEFISSLYDRDPQTSNTTCTGWSKAIAPIKAPASTSQPQIKPLQAQANIKTVEGVKAVQYSDKSIVLFGNTYPIKDKIKEQGGRFNKFLKIDGQNTAGWILPINNNFANQFLNK